MSPQRTLALCRRNQSSPWLCQPPPAWGSPICSPTAHQEELGRSTKPPQGRGKPRCQWAMGTSLGFPDHSLGRFQPRSAITWLKQETKNRGEEEITVSKEASRLTVQKNTENLHRQFTCLQGVNCSWHFTRRQHLPWNYHCFKSS